MLVTSAVRKHTRLARKLEAAVPPWASVIVADEGKADQAMVDIRKLFIAEGSVADKLYIMPAAAVM